MLSKDWLSEPISEDMLRAAREAIARFDARPPETIEEWADRLAADFCASDNEIWPGRYVTWGP